MVQRERDSIGIQWEVRYKAMGSLVSNIASSAGTSLAVDFLSRNTSNCYSHRASVIVKYIYKSLDQLYMYTHSHNYVMAQLEELQSN